MDKIDSGILKKIKTIDSTYGSDFIFDPEKDYCLVLNHNHFFEVCDSEHTRRISCTHFTKGRPKIKGGILKFLELELSLEPDLNSIKFNPRLSSFLGPEDIILNPDDYVLENFLNTNNFLIACYDYRPVSAYRMGSRRKAPKQIVILHSFRKNSTKMIAVHRAIDVVHTINLLNNHIILGQNGLSCFNLKGKPVKNSIIKYFKGAYIKFSKFSGSEKIYGVRSDGTIDIIDPNNWSLKERIKLEKGEFRLVAHNKASGKLALVDDQEILHLYQYHNEGFELIVQKKFDQHIRGIGFSLMAELWISFEERIEIFVLK